MLMTSHGIEFMVSDRSGFKSQALDMLPPFESWFPHLSNGDKDIYFIEFCQVYMRAEQFRLVS